MCSKCRINDAFVQYHFFAGIGYNAALIYYSYVAMLNYFTTAPLPIRCNAALLYYHSSAPSLQCCIILLPLLWLSIAMLHYFTTTPLLIRYNAGL
jgi:hypothetical protein